MGRYLDALRVIAARRRAGYTTALLSIKTPVIIVCASKSHADLLMKTSRKMLPALNLCVAPEAQLKKYRDDVPVLPDNELLALVVEEADGEIAELRSRLADTQAERDEADRRAGAAERNLAFKADTIYCHQSWNDMWKRRLGYSTQESFDNVWWDVLLAAEGKGHVPRVWQPDRAFAAGERVLYDRGVYVARKDGYITLYDFAHLEKIN